MSNDLLNLNYNKVISEITGFISEQVRLRKKNGVIIGLSGGLDSSVCLALATRAIGRNKIVGLIMPERGLTPKEDVHNARDLAKEMKINFKEIHFERAKRFLLMNVPTNKLSSGNLSARIRMALLYHHAAISNLLVLGTSDKSELMIGYFTKFGDGAADILPLGGLYKSQVKLLGKQLGLSEQIVNQPSSPRFWKGHVAEKEIGLKYNEIDAILICYLQNDLINCKQSKRKIKSVINMITKSQHKREHIPIITPKLDSNLYMKNMTTRN